jgi:hypothetical protein
LVLFATAALPRYARPGPATGTNPATNRAVVSELAVFIHQMVLYGNIDHLERILLQTFSSNTGVFSRFPARLLMDGSANCALTTCFKTPEYFESANIAIID